MATMELEAAVRPAALDAGRAAAQCGADELRGLLAHLTEQIIDADRRHSEVLRQMHERLSHLSVETRSVRTQTPEHVETLSRIEGSMASLADRVSEASIRPAQPAALRSAVDGSTAGLMPRASNGIDPFEVFDTDRPETSSEPWDAEAAEALTRLHESGETGYAAHTPDPESAPVTSAPAPSAAAQPLPAPTPAAQNLAAPPSTATLLADPDKVWLADQLAALALRFEQSMGDLHPQGAAQTLSDRFNDFEDRLAAAFEALATRSDVEALGLIEAHINELALHLEAAQSQLARLEAIETQLQSVTEHLSDERMTQVAGLPAAMPSGAELQRLATDAAELAATRVHSLVGPAAGSDTGSEIRAMMSRFMDERRLGDEQMVSMLDTMQQALIRVLDRMDAMEMAQIKSALPVNSPGAPSAPYAAAITPPEERREPHFGIPSRPAPVTAPEPQPIVAETVVAAQPVAAETPAPAAANSIDRIRQDFKADAQRAKQKAAMEAEAAATVKIEPKNAARKQAPGAKAAADAPAPARAAGSSGRRGLILGALTLVVAITAGALMLPKLKSGSKPTAAKIEQSQKPAVKKSDKTAAPAADSAAPASSADATSAPAPAAESMPSDVPDLPAEAAPQTPSTPETVIDDLSLGEELPDSTPKPAAKQSSSGMLPLGLELQSPTSAPLASSLLKIDGGNQPAAIPAALSMMPGSTPAVTGQQAGTLDLPPATVGPLSLRLAAAKGDPSAEFEVGSRLAEGKGTSQNLKEAHRWYQRSATRGFAQAQYRLGTLFERGLGIQQDLNRARIWYQRAAEQGNVKAMHNLAVLSAGSQSGAPDYETAAHWFREAALRNLSDSQFNIGVLHESGLGVEKNLVEAYKWFTLAAAGGDKEAARRIDTVRAQLTSEQLASAQILARDFVALRTDIIANDPRAAGEDWKKRQSAGDNG